jgi:hypothetical protein
MKPRLTLVPKPPPTRREVLTWLREDWWWLRKDWRDVWAVARFLVTGRTRDGLR